MLCYHFVLQVFNKLLTLASAASQTTEMSLWTNLLISTGGVSVSMAPVVSHVLLLCSVTCAIIV